MVYQVSQAVKVPVIGMGGIANGEDVAEFLICGAVAAQVGTANFWDPQSSVRLINEFGRFLEKEKIASAAELVGTLRREE